MGTKWKQINHVLMKKVLERRSLLSIILFLGFTFCIYAPYELYLTNRSEFWFTWQMFWWMPLLVGITLIILAMLVGMLLKGKLLFLYEIILFIAAVCIYVQGNFLNLDVGVMNGAEVEWQLYYRHFILDIFILICIAAVLIIAATIRPFIAEKGFMWASLFFTAIQMVSLFVLLLPIVTEVEEDKNINVVSDKGLYDVGTESNIIIFILDMFDDEYFKEILESEPEISEELDGFTYFSNFTGSYSTTRYSLAHLSTGKYWYNQSKYEDWVKDDSTERQYLDEISDAGYQMYIYSTMIPCFSQRFVNMAENNLNVPLRISNKQHFMYDIYQLAVLKYFPDFVKPYLWMTGTEFDYWKEIDSQYNPYTGDNLSFKEGIEKYGISKAEDERQIKFIHLEGSHYPYKIDENAEGVEEDSVSAVQCARGSLRIVQEYLDELKRNESYDNSVVIITADHGYYWDGVLTNPVFMVKPQKASGDLVINNAPVCQGDFAPTVLELAGLDEDHKYGESAFDINKDSQRERYFYQYYLSEEGATYRLIEYKMDPESNDPLNYELTDVEYTVKGKKIKHSEYCKTCKEGADKSQGEYDPPRIIHQKDKRYPE